MARRDEHEEAVNADSFLDIVASVVSVLIIMVMMTGLRIKHAPPDTAGSLPSQQLAGELKRQTGVEKMLKDDVVKIAHTFDDTRNEALRRERERDALALAVTQMQQAEAKPAAAPAGPPNPETRNKIIAAETRLDMLRQQTQAVENAPAVVEKIENFPSPVARTVDGRELHFQLHHGRLAYVPLNELIEVAMNDAASRKRTLIDTGELSNSVPPQEGFRPTYTIKLHDATAEGGRESGRRAKQLEVRVVLTAVSDTLGELVDEALGTQSQFRAVLADRHSNEATITLWIYPDSFDSFRKVKKELYRLGYPVAARPLPEGVPIIASSEGTKSTAE